MRDGIVRSLRDFGAFVDLGGVDGLVHVSKLSWERVNHPKEVLSEGQQIKVKIEKIDAETGKIALSYREAAANPWDKAEEKFAVGSSVHGKVTKIMDFGAFVRLEAGIEGMIHISELDHKRVHRTSDVVSEGQEVDIKVLSVDRGKQRIALSLKALTAAPVRETKVADEDQPLPKDAPKRPRKRWGHWMRLARPIVRVRSTGGIRSTTRGLSRIRYHSTSCRCATPTHFRATPPRSLS